MEAIKTEKLVKKYKDKTAVKGLELTVYQGELYGLLGVNGAGKSTTIKMLSCLTQPTSGEAWVMGRSIKNEAEQVKAIMNVSPQETAVAAKLSVRENLEFIARIYGCNKKESKEKARKMIEDFSMEEIAKCRAATLSGGWQRRLSIAMALITQPDVLFLDEPTNAIDEAGVRLFYKIVREEALRGAVVLISSHINSDIRELTEEIYKMEHGVLQRYKYM